VFLTTEVQAAVTAPPCLDVDSRSIVKHVRTVAPGLAEARTLDLRAVDLAGNATRDLPSVDAGGRELETGIEGVVLQRLAPLADHRGSVVPFLNTDELFWAEPVVYAYEIMIRPGRIKGWGMHERQTDRYFLANGSVRVALYDGREESPSHERIEQFFFTDATPGLLMIPPGVWHADQNWGRSDARIVNFPTRAYDHADPDKLRIDPHSDLIPFDWELRDG
jgi:dTDP-4-dehydrorhamnose 3,5-epimerase